ncbi:MAG: hypothetical protein HY721_11815 [Planctomycetes bacterium]|nr:hypothetical protein [Planctomycetota bacterium]
MTWSGLHISPELLAEGRKAPIAVPREPATAYRRALEALLEGSGISAGAAEAALSTGVTLLHGAQEVLFLANRLAEPGLPAARRGEAARGLAVTLAALVRERPAAYALQQLAGVLRAARGAGDAAGDAAPAAAELPRLPRLKDYMTPLEAAMEEAGVLRVMEPERLGQLLVRLDEIYDDAALALDRLFHLASRPVEEARALAPDLLRRLYTDFARASLADHVMAEHEQRREEKPEPGRGTGLIDLLPELARAFEAL